MLKRILKTCTIVIRGWALASLPEKELKCFEDIKKSRLKPDRAVNHCFMTSLLSEDYLYSGIEQICSEMVELSLTIDMGTAVHSACCLRKIEIGGGDKVSLFSLSSYHEQRGHKVSLKIAM